MNIQAGDIPETDEGLDATLLASERRARRLKAKKQQKTGQAKQDRQLALVQKDEQEDTNLHSPLTSVVEDDTESKAFETTTVVKRPKSQPQIIRKRQQSDGTATVVEPTDSKWVKNADGSSTRTIDQETEELVMTAPGVAVILPKDNGVVLDENLKPATGGKAKRIMKQEKQLTKKKTTAAKPKQEAKPKVVKTPSSQITNVEKFIAAKREELIGHKSKLDTQRGIETWTCDAVTLRMENGNPNMVFVIERVSCPDWPEANYKIGYYIIGKKGVWVRPMMTPMFSQSDWEDFITQATKEGTIKSTLVATPKKQSK